MFSGENVDDSIILVDDDFESYNDTLGGNWSEVGTGEVSIGTETGNTFLNLTQTSADQSKWVENMFNKTYTDGSIYVNYRVKPSQGSATMFRLIQEKDKKMLRLPLFVEDGKIKVTGASGAETEVGTYTAGKWYDVSAKFDIDTGLADIMVQESGAGTVLKKTGMPTGLTSVCGLRMQIWGAVGTSSFDNINVKYEAPKADSSDAYIIYDDFENGISDKYTSVGTSGIRFDIGTEDSNHFLNITKTADQNNVHIRRYLDKKQTTGTVHISYKVKPQIGGSTMLWANQSRL